MSRGECIIGDRHDIATFFRGAVHHGVLEKCPCDVLVNVEKGAPIVTGLNIVVPYFDVTH